MHVPLKLSLYVHVPCQRLLHIRTHELDLPVNEHGIGGARALLGERLGGVRFHARDPGGVDGHAVGMGMKKEETENTNRRIGSVFTRTGSAVKDTWDYQERFGLRLYRHLVAGWDTCP